LKARPGRLLIQIDMGYVKPEDIDKMGLVEFDKRNYPPYSAIVRRGASHFTRIKQDDGWDKVIYFIKKELVPI